METVRALSSKGRPVHHCHMCHRHYKRPEHLKRHLATHDSSLRKSRCSICGRSFSRADALKRHSHTCGGRVHDAAKHMRRRACDRCVSVKKACDFHQPCSTCLDKGTVCVYTVPSQSTHAAEDLSDNLSDGPSVWLPVAEAAISGADWLHWSDVDGDLFDLAENSWNEFLTLVPSNDSRRVATDDFNLTFLDNFTKQTGLVNSFDCGPLSLRLECLEFATSIGSILNDSDDSTHLIRRCQEIVNLIQEVASVRYRNSSVDIVWSVTISESCHRFFAPQNVRKYVHLYWSIWHPNVNILHKPTMDLASIKPGLLAAIAIIGAAVSPDGTDGENARVWFNSVEEIVFTDSELCNVSSASSGLTALAIVQALQAGYIVCLYQNWEGNDLAKSRIRRHRFNTLVSAIRDIGIHNAKHTVHHAIEHFDWNKFAAQEQLIRTIIWIFLFDTAFVIFNNLPPRMVIREMNMDTACSEDIFQARSPADCFTLLRKDQSYTTSLTRKPNSTFYHAAQSLCMQDLSEGSTVKLADLGPLNLFAITSSIHSMLFHYQNGFHQENQLGTFRRALDNWKTVWARYRTQDLTSCKHNLLGDSVLNPTNMWQRVGFIKHASDYWLLASLILDRLCIAERRILPGERNDDHRSELPVDGSIQNAVSRYDETSMQQVNDLIADLRGMDLSAL